MLGGHFEVDLHSHPSSASVKKDKNITYTKGLQKAKTKKNNKTAVVTDKLYFL
jgi:hypothetical protein